MSAWLSFFGGYAKGAVEQIDEQRKKEEQFIQDRMKMAAATRLTRQKEMEAQKKGLMDAQGELSALPAWSTASEPQKIALLASPVIRKQFIERTNKGENVNLDDLMTVNAESLKQYKTVNDYIAQFKAAPKPLEQQQTEAFQQPKRAFGARVGSDMDALNQNAARFGMKGEEALAWENGAMEPDVPANVATLKADALKPTDIDSRMKNVEADALRARDMIANGDVAGGEALQRKVQTEAVALRETQKMLEGEEKYLGFAKMRDRIREELARGGLSKPERQQREAQLAEMARIERIGDLPKGDGADKTPTFATLRTAASNAGAEAVRIQFGNLAKDGKIILETGIDGTSTVRFNQLDKETQDKVNAVRFAASAAVLNPYRVTEAGKLAWEAVGLGSSERQQQQRSAEAAAVEAERQRSAEAAQRGSAVAARAFAPAPANPVSTAVDSASMPAPIATMPPRPATTTAPAKKTMTQAQVEAYADKYGVSVEAARRVLSTRFNIQ